MVAVLEEGGWRRRAPPEQPLIRHKIRNPLASRRALIGSAVAMSAACIAATTTACSSGGHASTPTTRPTGTTTSTSSPATGSSAGWNWLVDSSPAIASLNTSPATTVSSVLAPSQASFPWIAAGSRSSSAGTSTATVWVSTDSQSWTAQPLTGPGVFSEASSATSWKNGTVVVGSIGQGANRHAAVWISSGPGVPFSSVPVSDSGSGAATGSSGSAGSTAASTSEMRLVTAGNLGYFAAGAVNGQPSIWYSTNGNQWSLSSDATRFFDGLAGARINTLLATSGLVYAAGSVTDGAATDAALWSTQDGLNWRAAQPPQGAFSGQGDHVITGLAVLGTGQGGTVGLVAVGALDSGSVWTPASWISPDGSTWSQPYASFPQEGTVGGVVRAITAVPTLAGTSELFAVGGNNSVQDAWKSTDGMRWTRMALPEQAASSTGWRATIVSSNGSAVAVGDSDPGEAHLLVRNGSTWNEPSANPSTFGPVGPIEDAAGLQQVAGKLVLTVKVSASPQAIGNAKVSTVSLSTSDGITWAGPATSPGPVVAAVPGPPGATAVGLLGSTWIAAGNAGTQSPAGPAVGWTSGDGSSWSTAVTLDPQPGVLAQSAAAVCTGSNVAVVVGAAAQARSGTSATAWYSPSGSRWKQATINSSSAPGALEWMDGCAVTGSGFAAYGATAPSGSPAPAVWTSSDGSRWTLQQSDAMGRGAPAPIASVAASGSRWIAVAGSDPDGSLGAPNHSPTGFYGAALVYPPSASGTAVWASADGGSSWQRVDTGASVWAAAAGASLERAGFAGSTAVVAGVDEGRLEVWSGTPGL